MGRMGKRELVKKEQGNERGVGGGGGGGRNKGRGKKGMVGGRERG